MCRPTYFAVTTGSTRGWIPRRRTTTRSPSRQWETLRQTYLDLGHTVELIDPLPGLPDMVFAANGATVVDGRVLAVQFRDAERADEGPAYAAWFRERRLRRCTSRSTPTRARATSCSPGTCCWPAPGFRTAHAAHAETQEVFGRPVITLQLVDPRYYHLDTALCVLDDTNVAYLPGGVLARLAGGAAPAVPGRGHRRRRRTPRCSASTRSATAARGAAGPGHRPDRRSCASGGYQTVGVDVSELRKAGGGPKCCTLEVRGHDERRHAYAGGARRGRALDRAQLPPAAGGDRRGRGRLGDRRRRPPLPGLPGRLLGAELRPPAPGADRRRARPARPGHADQPRVRARPVRRRSATSWPSCAARTWCCR